MGLEEPRLERHQGQVAETCWIRCSDKGHNRRRMSHMTYPFEAELVVVHEGHPLTVATEAQPVVAVVEQLCE